MNSFHKINSKDSKKKTVHVIDIVCTIFTSCFIDFFRYHNTSCIRRLTYVSFTFNLKKSNLQQKSVSHSLGVAHQNVEYKGPVYLKYSVKRLFPNNYSSKASLSWESTIYRPI